MRLVVEKGLPFAAGILLECLQDEIVYSLLEGLVVVGSLLVRGPLRFGCGELGVLRLWNDGVLCGL